MTRRPLPRHNRTLRLTVELSAKDAAEADQRLDLITGEIRDRLGKSTFRRLPGKPKLTRIQP